MVETYNHMYDILETCCIIMKKSNNRKTEVIILKKNDKIVVYCYGDIIIDGPIELKDLYDTLVKIKG